MNMVQVLMFRFLVHFLCYLWKGPFKRDFLDIYLTTFLGDRKFKSTSANKGHLFFEIFQNSISGYKMKKKKEKVKRKEKKNAEKSCSCFWDNWVRRCCNKLCLLRTEYLPSTVNVLTNSPNILHITRGDFFQLNYIHGD